MSHGFEIQDATILPGERKRIEIPIARLPTENWMSLPVEVVCGRHDGPRLWLSAAVHGDELNGMEIIRRVLERLDAKKLHGTILAVPIVNVFGFVIQSRYLPDRRDLNRSFPGSNRGSLASRLAHLFMSEIVDRCTHGIDLHTGSNYRTNLPQVRGDLEDEETRRCAEVFGAPAMIHSELRPGSLRQAAIRLGKKVLVYEAGEPMRFDFDAIKLGVSGVLRVMACLGMRDSTKPSKRSSSVKVVKSSWVRANRSGIVQLKYNIGERVTKHQSLATIADAFGDDRVTVKAPFDGMIIGHTNNPLVHQGDAILHVAKIDAAPGNAKGGKASSKSTSGKR